MKLLIKISSDQNYNIPHIISNFFISLLLWYFLINKIYFSSVWVCVKKETFPPTFLRFNWIEIFIINLFVFLTWTVKGIAKYSLVRSSITLFAPKERSITCTISCLGAITTCQSTVGPIAPFYPYAIYYKTDVHT